MADKKDEILDAAHKHFSKRGYNVSMADIAKEVGIKTPSLYSHYSGKDEIIFLIVERQVAIYTEFLMKLYESGSNQPLAERLENIYFSIVRYYYDHDKLRFWRNILLIDNEELGKRCSKLLFDLEMLQLDKMKQVFEQYITTGTLIKESIEGDALLFLAIIQGALEGQLLCHGTDGIAEEFTKKTWKAYRIGILGKIIEG